jgi:hypothetical protein
LLGKLAAIVVLVVVASSPVARADDEATEPAVEPAFETADEFHSDSEPEAFYPPPVGGPALRLLDSPTRAYVDGAFAVSEDLSALPYIAGRGQNFRFAAGGVWRWRQLSFEGEIPFLHVTTIDVRSILNMPPQPQDQHQTALSLGDLTLGVTGWVPLVGPRALLAGLGIRGRLATHTTRFQFHLVNGTLADFRLPYYFHVEPTLILSSSLGRFMFVINQGAIALLGPDGNFEDQHIEVPTIYLWDAHYAVSFAPLSFLAASVELATQFQLNHVPGADFAQLNDVRAVWVAPSVQLRFGATRIDLIARLGLSRGQELYGVLEYVGTNSYTVRLTRAFN